MSGCGRIVALLGLILAAGASAATSAEAVVVNCTAPNASVQNAVNGADGPTTILVKGTCIGDVVIEKDDITLTGQRPGSTCDKALPGGFATIEGTVTIRAARTRIEHLTITGSGLGLDIGPQAQADIVCNDISGNEQTGVFVHGASQATLRDNMVTENGQRDLVPGDEDPTRFFECGLFVGDASSVDSFGNTYADNSYCGVAADRGGIFRNGSIVPHRQGYAPDPEETDVIVQRNCIPGDVSNCDASALGAFKHVAVEAFNLGAVDLRNAEVTGLVDVSATSTFRIDTIGFLTGDVSNLAAGNVRIRNRNLDNGRNVSFEGFLLCDANSGNFFSSVQCGQTCTGLDAAGNLTCTP